MGVAQLARTWIDAEALYAAVDDARIARHMSWREVGRELDLAPSFFTRLGDGTIPDTRNVCLLCDWLGAKVDDFRAPEGARLPRNHRLADDKLYAGITQEQADATTARILNDDA